MQVNDTSNDESAQHLKKIILLKLTRDTSIMFNAIKHTGSFSDASNGVTAVKQDTAIDATIRRYLLLSFSLNRILSHSSMFKTRS